MLSGGSQRHALPHYQSEQNEDIKYHASRLQSQACAPVPRRPLYVFFYTFSRIHPQGDCNVQHSYIFIIIYLFITRKRTAYYK